MKLVTASQHKTIRGISTTYPGGKGSVGVYQTIINCMPPHDLYIEAFLGGGAILRHKQPAKRNVGVDLDHDVICAWQQVRFPSLELIHGDALEILANWSWHSNDPTQALVYCDPPYLKTTRRSRRKIYKHDLARTDQHSRLLSILNGLPCLVMISGYSCPLYESLIGHWRRIDFQATNRSGQATVETIWLNFPVPSELHDYQYLGKGFRERERIKRKRQRWKVRLSKMSKLERQAMLWALNEDSHHFTNHRLE
jgi:DNA adenine methylase